jgi:restriction endonuclease S subunit
MKDETEEQHYEDGVFIKTLGEVCEVNQGNSLIKTEMNDGIYDVIGGGKIIGKHNQKNRDGDDFTLTRVGDININYIDKPYYLTDNGFSLKSKQKDIMTKYLYYLLSHNKDYLINLYQGTAQKVISKTNLKSIKIPIPSLECQQEIVKYLDFIYEKANKTSNEKIAELKMLNEFCLNNQKLFGENIVNTLDEVCSINPENMKSGQYTEINYIDIASVKGGQILELQKLTNDFPSRAKRIVKKGDILYSSVRPNLKGYVYISDDIQNGIASTGFADIRVKEPNTILSKYLYYIMTSDYISDDLISKAKGAQYPAVSFYDFETINIPIPSLDKQQEIIEYCEYNDILIKQLEKEISNNKRLAQQFITGIVKLQIQEVVEEQDNYISLNTESINDVQEPVEVQDDTISVIAESINEVQDEIETIEEDVVIEPKPKVKKIVKRVIKKVKKPIVIVEEDIEV